VSTRPSPLIAALTTLSLAWGSTPWAWAAPADAPTPTPSASPASKSFEKELQEIPKRPSAPAFLQTAGPQEIFKCERVFIYRGKPLPCDSYMRQDAERLRPIVSSVQPALNELNVYQNNRRKVTTLAYVATAGLVLALVSRLIPKSPENTLISARDVTLIGGLGAAGGSVLYGLSFLRTNETHLGNSVELYNRAHPRDPIELQFSTGINF
jgi:hypothetical protein